MCGGGSGSQTTTQSSSPPPQVQADYQGLVNRATTVANTPYTPYSGEGVAPLSNQMLAGLGGVNQYANTAQPYLQTAGQMTQQAAAPVTPTAYSGSAIGQFMNPFTSDVVQATQAQMNNQNQQQAQFLNSQNIGAGAFGGDRAGVSQAVLAGQQQTAEAPVIAGLNQANYNQALAEFNNQQQTGLQSQEFNQGQLGQMATQYGNLGVAAQQAGLQGAGAQMQAGAIPQTEQQAIDNYLQGQYNQGQAYPFQTTSFLGNIIEGIGSQTGGTSATTSPGPSGLSQALGAGTALAGLGINAAGNTGVQSAVSGLGSFLGGLGIFSDVRMKENVEPIGRTFDGQTIHKFNYKGDPRTQIGLLAHEVERSHPHAVGEGFGGLKYVDYDAATRESHRAGFQGGGEAPGLQTTVGTLGLGKWSPQGALQMSGVAEPDTYAGLMGETNLRYTPGGHLAMGDQSVQGSVAPQWGGQPAGSGWGGGAASPMSPMPAPALRTPRLGPQVQVQQSAGGGRIDDGLGGLVRRGFQSGGAQDPGIATLLSGNTETVPDYGFVDTATPVAIAQGTGSPDPSAGIANLLYSSGTGSGAQAGGSNAAGGYAQIGTDKIYPSQPNLSGEPAGFWQNPGSDFQTQGAEASLAGLINRPGIETTPTTPAASAAPAAAAPAASAPAAAAPAATGMTNALLNIAMQGGGGSQPATADQALMGLGGHEGHGGHAGGGRIGFQDGGYRDPTGFTTVQYGAGPGGGGGRGGPSAPIYTSLDLRPRGPAPAPVAAAPAPAAAHARQPTHTVHHTPAGPIIIPHQAQPLPPQGMPFPQQTPPMMPPRTPTPFHPPHRPYSPTPDPPDVQTPLIPWFVGDPFSRQTRPPQALSPPPVRGAPPVPDFQGRAGPGTGVATRTPPLEGVPEWGMPAIWEGGLGTVAKRFVPPWLQVAGRVMRPTPAETGELPSGQQPMARRLPVSGPPRQITGPQPPDVSGWENEGGAPGPRDIEPTEPDPFDIGRWQNEGGRRIGGRVGLWQGGANAGLMGQMPLAGATGYTPQGYGVTGFDSQGAGMGAGSVASKASGFDGLFGSGMQRGGRIGRADGGIYVPTVTPWEQEVNWTPLQPGHFSVTGPEVPKQDQTQSLPNQLNALAKQIPQNAKAQPSGADDGLDSVSSADLQVSAPDDAGYLDDSSFNSGFGLGGLVRRRGFWDGGGETGVGPGTGVAAVGDPGQGVAAPGNPGGLGFGISGGDNSGGASSGTSSGGHGGSGGGGGGGSAIGSHGTEGPTSSPDISTLARGAGLGPGGAATTSNQQAMMLSQLAQLYGTPGETAAQNQAIMNLIGGPAALAKAQGMAPVGAVATSPLGPPTGGVYGHPSNPSLSAGQGGSTIGTANNPSLAGLLGLGGALAGIPGIRGTPFGAGTTQGEPSSGPFGTGTTQGEPSSGPFGTGTTQGPYGVSPSHPGETNASVAAQAAQSPFGTTLGNQAPTSGTTMGYPSQNPTIGIRGEPQATPAPVGTTTAEDAIAGVESGLRGGVGGGGSGASIVGGLNVVGHGGHARGGPVGFGLGGIVRRNFASGGSDGDSAVLEAAYNPEAALGGTSPAAANAAAAAPAAAKGFDASAFPSNRAETTPAQRDAFNRAYAKSIGLNPDIPSGIGRAEGLNVPGVGPSSVDVENGKPFSFGDFQMNVRNGLGNAAIAAGADPRDPNQWQAVNKFAMDQMKKDLGPWKDDKYVESMRGGNAPSSSATATGPGPVGPGGLPGPDQATQQQAAMEDAARPPDKKLFPPGLGDTLIAMGAGMMAGTSPHAMVNIGTGIQQGMQYMQKQRELDMEWRKNDAQIQDYASQSRYRDAQTTLGMQNLQIERNKALVENWNAQVKAAVLNGQPIPPFPTLPSIGGGAAAAPAPPPAAAPAAPAPAPAKAPAEPAAPAGGTGKTATVPPVVAGPVTPPAATTPAPAPPKAPATAPDATTAAPDEGSVAPELAKDPDYIKGNQMIAEGKQKNFRGKAGIGAEGMGDEEIAQGTALVEGAKSRFGPILKGQETAQTGQAEAFKTEDEESGSRISMLQQQQHALQAMQAIMQKGYLTGKWADHAADIEKTFAQFDVDIGQPASWEEFKKFSTGDMWQSLKEQKGAVRNKEMDAASRMNPDPNSEPETNATIIATQLGTVKRELKLMGDYRTARKTGQLGQASVGGPGGWQTDWELKKENALNPYIKKELQDFGYAGQKGDVYTGKGLQEGQVYMAGDGQPHRWIRKPSGKMGFDPKPFTSED
jgi:hypothetical protein